MNELDINENKCIGRVEHYYLRERRMNINVSLEDLEDTEWFWSNTEIRKLDAMWKKDMPMTEIAEELRRSEVAVFLQCLDRISKGALTPRDWRIW